MTTDIRIERIGDVEVLTIDRREARNSLTHHTYAELETAVLAGAVGRERAAELLFTGEVIDAAVAKEMGLVSRVVPHDELMTTALGLAERIAANPPLAVQAIKQGLREALDPNWDDLGVWVSANLARLFQTADHREGVQSFLEKRPPNFTGH